MNTLIIHLVAITLIFGSCSAYSQIQNDSLLTFRNNFFGVTAEEVKANETARYMQDFIGFNFHSISFAGEFAELDLRIDYVFRNGKLTEGSYNIDDTHDLARDFTKLQIKLENDFGEPDFYANKRISASEIWIKQNDNVTYKGPELYWQFANGFVVLHASKFKDEESLTVLYVANKNINQYGSEKIKLPE